MQGAPLQKQRKATLQEWRLFVRKSICYTRKEETHSHKGPKPTAFLSEIPECCPHIRTLQKDVPFKRR